MRAPTLSGWILAYAGAGALMASWRFKWYEAAAVAVAWELAQRPLKEQFPGAFPEGIAQDTTAGAIADVGALLGGYYIAQRLNR